MNFRRGRLGKEQTQGPPDRILTEIDLADMVIWTIGAANGTQIIALV